MYNEEEQEGSIFSASNNTCIFSNTVFISISPDSYFNDLSHLRSELSESEKRNFVSSEVLNYSTSSKQTFRFPYYLLYTLLK